MKRPRCYNMVVTWVHEIVVLPEEIVQFAIDVGESERDIFRVHAGSLFPWSATLSLQLIDSGLWRLLLVGHCWILRSPTLTSGTPLTTRQDSTWLAKP